VTLLHFLKSRQKTFLFSYRLSLLRLLINTLLADPSAHDVATLWRCTSMFIIIKYAATLPCNLSLMACFADINVSQGSVATYARCCGTFNMHLSANLPRNIPVKKNYKT